MTYKFQNLEIYKLALEYIDLIYSLAEKLPRSEDFNLKSQITRAGTSIVLNIAEGSTSQSDAEQSRFLGMALRSLIETVACQDVIERRKYVTVEDLRAARELGSKLFAKVQAMKRFLSHPNASEDLSARRSPVVRPS
ncbi:MAG: four helix bundle protein [Pyrinomonadaceae bacterium]|nr:four helix bundle protein [Pyrinomonadaceae bacterium]